MTPLKKQLRTEKYIWIGERLIQIRAPLKICGWRKGSPKYLSLTAYKTGTLQGVLFLKVIFVEHT